jgi:hypothetical protein
MTPGRRARAVSSCAAAVVALSCPSRAEDASSDRSDKDKKECLDAAERGQSLRDDGKYRDARESFLSCARDGCPKILVQSCTRWLRELDQDAPTIVFGAKNEEDKDVIDVKVSVDGESFATVLDGKPLLADSGKHVLRFERDGSVPVEQEVVLRAGEKARLVSVLLRSVHPPATSPGPTTTAAPMAADTKPAPPEPLFSPRHVTAGALALGAVAAAATGAFFVLESNGDKDSAGALRVGLASNACTHAAATGTCGALGEKVNAQHQEMTVAAALFAGAAGLAAGGIVTWLLWPRSRAPSTHPSAWVAPTRGGATIQVGWGFQ